MANDRFATGRPATVHAEGGDSGVDGGQRVRIVGFRMIARTSSSTKTPAKLEE
jgi:hypothetical protein